MVGSYYFPWEPLDSPALYVSLSGGLSLATPVEELKRDKETNGFFSREQASKKA